MSKGPSPSQATPFSSPRLYHFCGYCFKVCGTFGALTQHGEACPNALTWDQSTATKAATIFRDLYIRAGLNTMSPQKRLQSTHQNTGQLVNMMRQAMGPETASSRRSRSGQGTKRPRPRAQCEGAPATTTPLAGVEPPPLPHWAEKTPSSTLINSNATVVVSARVSTPAPARKQARVNTRSAAPSGDWIQAANAALSASMRTLDSKIEGRSKSGVKDPPGARFRTAFFSFVDAVRTRYPKAATPKDLPQELAKKGLHYGKMCGAAFDLSSHGDIPLLRSLIDEVKALKEENKSLSSSLQTATVKLGDVDHLRSQYEYNRKERKRLADEVKSHKASIRDMERQYKEKRSEVYSLRDGLKDARKLNDHLTASLRACDITSAAPIDASTPPEVLLQSAEQYLRQLCTSSHHIILSEVFAQVKIAFLRIPLQSPRYVEYLSAVSVRTLVIDGLQGGQEWWDKLRHGEIAELEYSTLRIKQNATPECLLYSKCSSNAKKGEANANTSSLSSGLRTVLKHATNLPSLKHHALWGLLGDIKIRLNPAGATPSEGDSPNFYHPLFADATKEGRRRFGFRLSATIIPLSSPLVLREIDSKWSPPHSVNGSIASKFPTTANVLTAMVEAFLKRPSLTRGGATPASRHALLRGSFTDVAEASLLLLRQDPGDRTPRAISAARGIPSTCNQLCARHALRHRSPSRGPSSTRPATHRATPPLSWARWGSRPGLTPIRASRCAIATTAETEGKECSPPSNSRSVFLSRSSPRGTRRMHPKPMFGHTLAVFTI